MENFATGTQPAWHAAMPGMAGLAANIQFDLMRSKRTPLYMQLASQLHTGLRHGLWAAHEALPSERVLSEALKVSRDTARKALALLCQRGLLKRVRGSGTFLASPVDARLTHAPAVGGQQWSLLSASAEEVLALGLSPNAKVVHCSHLRYTAAGGKAWVVSIVPQQYLPRPAGDLSDMDAYFRSTGWGDTRVLERVRATCANEAQSQALGVALGTALLHVLQLRYARQGQALELCHVYWLGASADYCVELRRAPSAAANAAQVPA